MKQYLWALRGAGLRSRRPRAVAGVADGGAVRPPDTLRAAAPGIEDATAPAPMPAAAPAERSQGTPAATRTSLMSRARAVFRGRPTVVNQYGPTEGTMTTTSAPVVPGPDDTGPAGTLDLTISWSGPAG